MQKIKFDFEATKQLIYAPNSNAPIGAPVDADGNVANDGTAIGIVLCRKNESNKYWVKQNLVVMVAGYCDIIDAQAIWGDEYSAEAIAAMSDIIFCDDHKIGGGGGWPADLPKPSVGGYGYTDEDDTVHKIDEKYLPSGGGAMVVNFTIDENYHVTSDKTADEIIDAASKGVNVISNIFELGDSTPVFEHLILVGANTVDVNKSISFVKWHISVNSETHIITQRVIAAITHTSNKWSIGVDMD